MHLDVDLERASIFLDFDGTVTTADVGMHLLDRFARPEWWDLHEQYEAGAIGSRECLVDQWELVTADEGSLRAAAREVTLDPGFGPLVEALRREASEVVVVSDGFGFYVDEVCAPYDLDVVSNTVDFATGQLCFPHEDRCCPCSTCGTCKQAPIKDARHRGRTTVLVGDGASDRKAVLLADVVFAKGPLADWCEYNGVVCRRFANLDDVREALTPS
jgi:2-hydroxy-3-keto-5-methylthiopentenyl-1-phosphate phosphatase